MSEEIEYDAGEPVEWADDAGKVPLRRWRSVGPAHPGDILRVTFGRRRGRWYVERSSHPQWPPACRVYRHENQARQVAVQVMAETGRTWEEIPIGLSSSAWVAGRRDPAG